MVANFNKWLWLLFAAPSLAFGAGDNQAITHIAEQRLQQATALAEQTIQRCQDQQIVLPKGLLDNIDLSDDDKYTALAYFSIKAANQCMATAREVFLRATLFARAAKLPGYSPDNDPQEGKVLFALGLLPWELRKEARYLQLPAAARKALEQLVPLQQGFKLLESARNLGLINH